MTETNRKLTEREWGEQGTIDLQEKEKQDAMDKGKKCKTKKSEMHARVSWSIEELSRIYQEEANLDGLRICQESIIQTESFSMDQEGVEKLSRQIPESLMDREWANFCRERKSKGLDR